MRRATASGSIPSRFWSFAACLAILCSAAAAPATEWYVSPSGNGNGSFGNPWSIATAFNSASTVQPGDTVWLRGGTYVGNKVFYPRFNGTSAQPIIVRQYPGERATLKGGIVWNQLETLQLMYCTYTHFWGFEITSSVTNRVSADYAHPYPWPTDIDIAGGMTTTNGGSGCKLINIIMHDCAGGIGGWNSTLNFEAAGCIIYYNGWQGPDRGHGHGCYTQNNTTLKLFKDNIFFANYGNGTQAYGSDSAYVNNMTFDNNTYFDNGILATNSESAELILGGGNPSQNVVATYNRMYRRNGGIGFEMGDPAIVFMGTSNISGTASNNYMVCGLRVWPFHNGGLTVQNNTIVSDEPAVWVNSSAVAQNPSYNWNYNTYHCASSNLFYRTYGASTWLQTWAQWRSTTGFDANGTRFTSNPTTTVAFVRPNPYEAGRGHVTVYNWAMTDFVNVDVSSILSVGSNYVVKDVQNYFGPSVASGTYAGGTISIPMTSTAVAQPAGNPPEAYVHTGKQYGAFVVMGVGNQAPAVSAGNDQSIPLPALTATLAGTVSDDGLPDGAIVSKLWTVVSGPGSVTFADNHAPATTATFSTGGTYVLRLTATDTALSVNDDVTISLIDISATMALHLPFDDASGTIADDTSGHGRDGTLVNGPTWVAGKLAGAVHFDELNDYVTVPDFAYGPEFTISFWFKPDDNAGTGYQYFFSHGTIDVNHSINILLAEDGEPSVGGKLRAYLRDIDDTAYSSAGGTLDANRPPLDGLYHLYTLTAKPGEGAKVYLDGVQAAADAARGGGGFDPNAALYLGARYDLTATRMYGGGLDDVRVYTVALSAPQVAALYAAASNAAPTANAGPDQAITLPAAATLAGSMSDDGQPAGCTSAWSKVSGPGTVTFANAAALNTTATFSAGGTYMLRLTVSDSGLSDTDDVMITVNAPSNLAPAVSASGPDAITAPTKTASLAGSVSDDGKPLPPAVTTGWTMVSGPGPVVFAAPAAVSTTAAFRYAGTYVLRLTADDGELSGQADVTITMDGDLRADFNNDGRVDGLDFLIWQGHFPTASGATKPTGDGNGDGKVDGLDFLVWQSCFGLWQ